MSSELKQVPSAADSYSRTVSALRTSAPKGDQIVGSRADCSSRVSRGKGRRFSMVFPRASRAGSNVSNDQKTPELFRSRPLRRIPGMLLKLISYVF